jgi:TolA-binding protein
MILFRFSISLFIIMGIVLSFPHGYSQERETKPVTPDSLMKKTRLYDLGIIIEEPAENSERAVHKQPVAIPGTQKIDREITQLEELLIRLTTLERYVQNQISLLRQDNDELRSLIQKLESGQTSSIRTVEAPKKLTAKDRYISGLKFYNSREYKKAIGEFEAAAQLAQDKTTRENSYFWIGDCYYRLQNYYQAIETLRVLTKTKNEKTDDALLIMGLSYKKLGNTKKALEQFEKIVETFPESEYQRLARVEIDRLKKL